MSIVEKINKHITIRKLAIVTYLIVLVVVFNPILLSLTVSYPTQGFLNSINALPPGSKIVWEGEYGN